MVAVHEFKSFFFNSRQPENTLVGRFECAHEALIDIKNYPTDQVQIMFSTLPDLERRLSKFAWMLHTICDEAVNQGNTQGLLGTIFQPTSTPIYEEVFSYTGKGQLVLYHDILAISLATWYNVTLDMIRCSQDII